MIVCQQHPYGAASRLHCRSLGKGTEASILVLPGIDAGEASLLDWARVGSLDALKESKPEDLTSLLNHLNQARPLTMQPPKVEEVRTWIAEANKLQPQVHGQYRRSRYPAMRYLARRICNSAGKPG